MRRLKLLLPIRAIAALTWVATLVLAFFGADAPSRPGRATSIGDADSMDAGTPIARGDDPYEAALEEEEPRHPEVVRLEALLCDRLASEVCAARRACGCRPNGEEGCEADERRACEAWLECAAYVSLDEAVAVDEVRLAACMQSIRADLASCDAWRLPPICHDLLVEPVSVGEPCAGDRAGCRGGQCDGEVCAALPGRGQRCEWACAPGLVCTDAMRCEPEATARTECGSAWDCPPRLACVEGVCARPGGVGARCEDADACARGMTCDEGRCRRADRCRFDEECGRLSRCAGDVVDRCVPAGVWPLASMGAECTMSSECGHDAVCVAGRCAGAPGVGQVCADGRCAAGAFCLRGRCVDRGPTRVGSPCELYAQDSCGPGLGCVWTTLTDGGAGGRCQRAAGLDAPCPTGACELGLRCGPVVDDGHCEPAFCGPDSIWACDQD